MSFSLVTWTGVVSYWMVMLAALAWGVVQLVDVPARQAFAVEMVGREDLMNAIALTSSVWNAAAVIGPSLAGVLIAFSGVPICFLVNAISYLAVIAGLALMRNLPTLLPDVARQPLQQRMLEGARYVRRDPVVGAMLIVVGVFALFSRRPHAYSDHDLTLAYEVVELSRPKGLTAAEPETAVPA